MKHDREYNENSFLERATDIHKGFYNYDNVVYVNARTKIIITCPIHGDFHQTPSNHLVPKGCRLCGVERSRKYNLKTNNVFLDQLISIFGDKYDYSKVYYVDDSSNVKIICKTHGEFERRATDLIYGRGCKICKPIKYKIFDRDSFISESNNKYNNRFSYDRVEYNGFNKRVIINCPTHGDYQQYPKNHLSCKNGGCVMCNNSESLNLKLKDVFITESINKYGNLYDYSNVMYCGSKTPVIIICNKHGEFRQTPNTHLRGHGCPNCVKITKDDFIEKSNNIFSGRYGYELVVYRNSTTKVKIRCPIHEYFMMSPYAHMNGYGCNRCKSSKGETMIIKYLEDNSVKYEFQKRFKDCRNKKILSFDFYLPSRNICVEFDGRQHYESIEFFGGVESFLDLKKRDEIKNLYCIDNNIDLLRIGYKDFENINNILDKKLKIII